MGLITIGNDPVTAGSGSTAGYTIIDRNVPADGSGTLMEAKLFAMTNLGGVKVGTFYVTTAGKVRCRAAAFIGDVEAGAAKSFMVTLPVMEGDLFGCYVETGSLARDQGPAIGMYFYAGDACVEGVETSVGDSANYTYSIGGEGQTAADISCLTLPATDLTSDGATLHGSATGLSAEEYATHRGFQWGETSGGPYTGDWSESDDYDELTSMNWEKELTGLEPGIPIYYRAYIKTSVIAEGS